MISITYTGNGNVIDLVNTPNLVLSGYDGLDNTPRAEIVTTTNPNLAGSQYQGSIIEERIISLTFYVYNVEYTKQELQKIFKSGEKGTLILKSDYREGTIECYFEEMVWDRFQELTVCQIFLKAPNPYFEGLEEIVLELDNVIEGFQFEIDIPEEGVDLGLITDTHNAVLNNESDVNIGLVIEIYALGNVVNPVVRNMTTDKFIGINYTLSEGDKLIINTNKGKKKITLENVNGTTNLINKMMRYSTFIELVRGANRLVFEADSGGNTANAYITYKEKYGAM